MPSAVGQYGGWGIKLNSLKCRLKLNNKIRLNSALRRLRVAGAIPLRCGVAKQTLSKKIWAR